MATRVNFGGKQRVIPNTYAEILSGVENPPSALTTGEVLVIDTGGNATWGGGSGVDGEFSQGLDSFYRFTSVQSAQSFLMGGKYSKYMENLFFPEDGVQGTPSVTFVKSATTVPAEITKTWGAYDFQAKCKFEGVCGNAVTTGDTPAVWEFDVDLVGDATDTHTLLIDGVTIGSYIVPAIPLSPASTAIAIAQDIVATASGYTVLSVIGNKIRVKAIAGDGSASNVMSFNYNTTGTAVGGVNRVKDGVTAPILEKGFAMKVLPSKKGVNFSEVSFYKSTFTGLAPDGISYNEITAEQATPKLIATTTVSTLQELIAWAKKDKGFNSYFQLVDNTGGNDVAIPSTDDNWIGATGGTENYDVNLMDTILQYINDTNIEFIVTTESFANSLSVFNQPVIDWVNRDSRFIRQLFITGGNNLNDFDGSLALCQELDSDVVNVVHGAYKSTSQLSPDGFRYWDADGKLFLMLGRLGGLEPQNSLTFKSINIAKEVHPLTEDEKIQALDSGLLVSYFNTDRSLFIVLQGVNTLQNNEFFFNEDGTTFSIQVKRIDAQVNKTLVIESNIKLLGKEEGANKKNLNSATVSEFTKAQLDFLTATETQDNLILGYRSVEVSFDQDNFFVTYEFEPNSEITKGFFTGTRVVF